MSIIIEQPENILVDSYSYFSPSLLEGFARTTDSIYDVTKIRRIRNYYNNASLLSAREASTLYHNFYGIQGIQASMETTDGDQYTLPKFLDYQTMRTPYSRSRGNVVDGAFSSAGTPSAGYLGFRGELRSVTSDMSAVFSQEPPDDENDFRGFIGFGMRLLEISGNIQSGLYGSSVQFYFDISTQHYTSGEPLNPLMHGTQISERQRYYNNLTYTALNGQEYPELAPTITGDYQKSTFTLRDNNGNSIVLRQNFIIYRVQTKYVQYKPYYGEGENPYDVIAIRARPLPPDPKISISGSGKFYSYRGNPVQPHNYGI